MKRFTTVGLPPVEKKDGNCPHCNSRMLGRLWSCSTPVDHPDRQTRTCRIFQLEASVLRLQAIVSLGIAWRSAEVGQGAEQLGLRGGDPEVLQKRVEDRLRDLSVALDKYNRETRAAASAAKGT